MGTDINMYAEQQRDGQWRLLGPMEENHEFFTDEDPDGAPYKPVEIYEARNYALFAMLADVRNPPFREEPYEYIAPLRSLPTDLSPEVAAWANYGADSLDGSWLTLRELLDFDWGGKVHQHAHWVDERIAYLFAPDRPFPQRPPDMSEDEFMRHVNYSPAPNRRGTQVYWTDTYADTAGPAFMQGVIGALQEAGDPDDVRIVFWFS